MEDLWITPSNTLKNTELPLKTNTHTKLFLENAKLKEENSKSNLSPMLPKEMLPNSPPLLLNNQFPLPLMPTTSNSMTLEFSLIAKTALTTELPLLDIPVMLGSSKTHGVNPGENLDISDSREETHVDLPMLLHTQCYEKCDIFI